ncbi:Adenine/guanine permease AZG1 [Linum perenne]
MAGAGDISIRRRFRHDGDALLDGGIRRANGRKWRFRRSVLRVHVRRGVNRGGVAAGDIVGDDIRGIVAGIRERGRTGLTALTVAGYFFLEFFFTPLLASIPAWAVGPPLILVGVLMMRPVMEIEWDDMRQAIPAFVTMILMPMTYSIACGLLGGIGTFVVLHIWDWGVAVWLKVGKVVGLVGGKSVVKDETAGDGKPAGGRHNSKRIQV